MQERAWNPDNMQWIIDDLRSGETTIQPHEIAAILEALSLTMGRIDDLIGTGQRLNHRLQIENEIMLGTIKRIARYSDRVPCGQLSEFMRENAQSALSEVEKAGMVTQRHIDAWLHMRTALEQIVALKEGYLGGDEGRKSGYRVAGKIAENALEMVKTGNISAQSNKSH